MDDAENPGLEIHGGKEERVAVFVDESFRFGAALYLVDVEGDPSCEACCDEGANQGDDCDDNGYDVNHDCGCVLPKANIKDVRCRSLRSTEDLSLEQNGGF